MIMIRIKILIYFLLFVHIVHAQDCDLYPSIYPKFKSNYSYSHKKSETVKLVEKYYSNEDDSEYTISLSKKKTHFALVKSSIFAPYGLMAGFSYGIGAYVSCNFSRFGVFRDSDYLYELEGQLLKDFVSESPRYYESLDSDPELLVYNISIGATVTINDYLIAYCGGGYGANQKKYKFATYYFDGSLEKSFWAHDLNQSIQGVVLEMGVVFVIKNIAISTGLSTLKFEKYELQFGVGLNF